MKRLSIFASTTLLTAVAVSCYMASMAIASEPSSGSSSGEKSLQELVQRNRDIRNKK